VALVLGLLASGTNVRRWTQTFELGSAAGREKIFPAAWKMFLERPLLGWGPGRNLVELGVRLRFRTVDTGPAAKDTHNGLLWVLTQTGLIGFIPYMVGLWLCLRAAWRGRARLYGIGPFALVVCVLVINLSVTWQKRKFFWLVLALGTASARTIGARRTGRAGVVRSIRLHELASALPTH
jgi:O-antigen ligase